MTFELLPAVDVADGQAVRLVQGRAGSQTTDGAPLAGGSFSVAFFVAGGAGYLAEHTNGEADPAAGRTSGPESRRMADTARHGIRRILRDGRRRGGVPANLDQPAR